MTLITTTSPLRDKIGALTPDEVVKFLNLLIYGEPGVGKTLFASTAEDALDTSPSLLIDCEGGTTTLRGRNIDVVTIRSIKELEKLHKELRESINPETGDFYYKTVSLDTLSELQKLDMRTIMERVVNEHPERDIEVPAQREWGMASDHVRQIVRKFRDLPCNTIFTCHAAIDVDKNTNAKSYAPNLPGKLKQDIPGFIDIVGFMSTAMQGEELVRQIQFAKTPRVSAKDRTNALGALVLNPTIPLLWDMIHTPKESI